MSLPEGVTTCTVTAGVPVTHTGAPVKAFVSIEPSVFLVHTATGTPLVDFLEELSINEGVAGQFTLPHTDQTGFQDENGNAYTNWYYTARISYLTPSKSKTKAPKIKVFQLTTGQTLVDLDALPGGAPALPYTAPTASVTSLAGLTGPVTGAQIAGLPEVSAAYLDKVSGLSKVEAAAAYNPRMVYKPQGLRRWAGALAIARNGGYATAAMVGDSTIFGVGADNTQATTDTTGGGFTSADQLRKRFNTFLGQALDAGAAVLPSDSRVTRTGAIASSSTGAFGVTSYRVDGAGNQMAFPGFLCTTIEIISVWIPGTSGALVYSVDGGADVTAAAGAGTGANTIMVTTISGLTSGTAHSVTIKAPASGRAYIVGVVYRAGTGIVVPRVGRPGATTLDLIQGVSGSTTAAGLFRRQLLLSSINAWAPDVLVLKLGINDSGLPGAGQAQAITPAQYKANLKQIALYQTSPSAAADAEFNAAGAMIPRKTIGGSVLLVIGPHAATVGLTPESEYYQAAREVCDEMDHVSLVNLADWYGSFTEAHDAAMGLQLAGSVHSTPKGYARDADVMFSALTSPQVIGVG